MKLFKLFFLTVFLLMAGLSYGQTGSSFAGGRVTTIASTTATTKITLSDSVTGHTYIFVKPVVFDATAYKGLVAIYSLYDLKNPIYKGNINKLKISGMTTGPGVLRDSLAIINLRSTLFSAWPLLALLLLRKRGRKEYGSNPGDHSKTSGGV
jgi:hypothetical protein